LAIEARSRENPRLVMVRLSGFGQTGPYRDKPGFGRHRRVHGRMRYVTGYPDRAPVRVGISIGDSLAAMFGVIGALMAIITGNRPARPGRGRGRSTKAVFAHGWNRCCPSTAWDGFVRERSGAALPGIVPSNTYPCSDGKYVVIGANADSIFKRMMRAIGRPDLAEDPSLADNAGRVRARTSSIASSANGLPRTTWTRCSPSSKRPRCPRDGSTRSPTSPRTFTTGARA
jgi:formyl-CoA transferase